METICLHCVVSGRVQGVFYRKNTQEQAIMQGVNGWVKNLEDGRVEAILCGSKASVETMKNWLAVGPALARVDSVEATEIPCEQYSHFEVR